MRRALAQVVVLPMLLMALLAGIFLAWSLSLLDAADRAVLGGAGAAALLLGAGLAAAVRRQFLRLSRAYQDASAAALAHAEALRESRQIMETVPDILYALDVEGKLTRWNRTAEEATGRTPEELRGRPILQLFPPEEHDVIAEAIRRAFATGYVEVEGDLLRRDGIVIPYQWTCIPLRDDRGIVVGLTGVGRDISERRRVEQALRASEERFHLATSDLIWDWDIASGALWCNKGAQTLFGYPAEVVASDSTWWSENIHPEDKDRVLDELDAFLNGPDQTFLAEYRFRRHDGSYASVIDRGIVVRDAGGKAVRMTGSMMDSSARTRAEEEIRTLNAQLEHRLQRLDALRQIDVAITSGLDLRATLGVVLDQVTAQLGVDAAAVLLLDPRAQTLEPAASTGFRTGALDHARVPVSRRACSRVALERQPLLVPDLGRTTQTFLRASQFAAEGFAAYFAVPLEAKGQVKGILEAFHRAPLDPDEEWIDFLETLAAQTAIVIENAGLCEGLRRAHAEMVLAYDATIEGWSRALDLRDKETEGHSRRVTDLTVRLARALGLGEDGLAHIRRGALLHDIGKMGIPDRILHKPGALSDEEWQVMRRHPEFAFELLAPIDFLRPALEVPYNHHEKWDGTGYPRGLKGEQIPLAARIFAAADIWDALSHDRPYRKAWPPGRVRDHIRSLAGTALDPAVVEALLRILASETPGWPETLGGSSDIESEHAESTHGASAPGTNGHAGGPAAHHGMAPQGDATGEPSGRSGLTVLVAEDHNLSAGRIEPILEAMGHEVLQAADGEEVWRLLRHGGVQVVIAPWDLPGIDGSELCRRIRSEATLAHLYVILTGHRDVETDGDCWRGHDAGADDVLARPIDARALAARLQIARRLLSVHAQLRDRTAQAERMYAALRHQNERLSELVATDPLTGLSNRRHFLEAMEAGAALAQRKGRPLSLTLLDVDRFKQFNDTYGHRAGDEVLCRVADILRSNVRAHDLVARYGGEEFVVLMPETEMGDSRIVAERLRAAIEGFAWTLRPVTASFGVATMDSGALDTSRLVDAADRALYSSKQRGRNCVTHILELSAASPELKPLPT